MSWAWHEHRDMAALADAVAAHIAADLDAALSQRGRAWLALAGGRTSPPVFRQLARQARDWSAVTIVPTDERWVAADHPDNNLQQMRQAFAAAAGMHWLALVPENAHGEVDAGFANAVLAGHPEAFDVCMLGMGADGHFASLFPGAADLTAALALPSAAAIATNAAYALIPDPMPAAGAHPRISLSLARLLHSRSLLLVISGADKRAVLERAQAETALPVAALLQAGHPQAHIHWSP